MILRFRKLLSMGQAVGRCSTPNWEPNSTLSQGELNQLFVNFCPDVPFKKLSYSTRLRVHRLSRAVPKTLRPFVTPALHKAATSVVGTAKAGDHRGARRTSFSFVPLSRRISIPTIKRESAVGTEVSMSIEQLIHLVEVCCCEGAGVSAVCEVVRDALPREFALSVNASLMFVGYLLELLRETEQMPMVGKGSGVGTEDLTEENWKLGDIREFKEFQNVVDKIPPEEFLENFPNLRLTLRDGFRDFVFLPVEPFVERFLDLGFDEILLDSRPKFLSSPSKVLPTSFAFCLRNTLPALQANKWSLLYSTQNFGRSFNRMASHVFYYPATIVVLIKTSTSDIIGAVMTCPLEECGGQKYLPADDGNSFLFSFCPKLTLLKPTGLGRNFVYFNTKNSFAPKGFGFGGRPDCCRIWVDDEMRVCYTTASDSTFEAGQLQAAVGTDFQIPFLVDEIEIWATGDDSHLQAQKLKLQRADDLRMERRQVDKSKLLESDFDKEHLLGRTFDRSKR